MSLVDDNPARAGQKLIKFLELLTIDAINRSWIMNNGENTVRQVPSIDNKIGEVAPGNRRLDFLISRKLRKVDRLTKPRRKIAAFFKCGGSFADIPCSQTLRFDNVRV